MCVFVALFHVVFRPKRLKVLPVETDRRVPSIAQVKGRARNDMVNVPLPVVLPTHSLRELRLDVLLQLLSSASKKRRRSLSCGLYELPHSMPQIADEAVRGRPILFLLCRVLCPPISIQRGDVRLVLLPPFLRARSLPRFHLFRCQLRTRLHCLFVSMVVSTASLKLLFSIFIATIRGFQFFTKVVTLVAFGCVPHLP